MLVILCFSTNNKISLHYTQLSELHVNLKPIPATEFCGKFPSRCSMPPVWTSNCVLHFPIDVMFCVTVNMLMGLLSDNGYALISFPSLVITSFES